MKSAAKYTTPILSNDVREKLIALDKCVEKMWDLSSESPEYREYHDKGRKLQEELISVYGFTPALINRYTYGEGGVIYG